MKLLHVDSSVLGTHSVSRKLSAEVVSQWVARHPDTVVEHLDLAVDSPNHFGPDALGIKTGVPAEPSEAQKRENAVSERLVSQFLAADVVVLGAPLYNFSIPSQLKAWIDRLAQPGRTFKYGEQGPVGLAGGKTLVVVSTRGGVYSTTESGRATEHQESYLRAIFGFMGVTDVRIVRAEGLAMGDAARDAALAQARVALHAATGDADNQPSAAQAA